MYSPYAALLTFDPDGAQQYINNLAGAPGGPSAMAVHNRAMNIVVNAGIPLRTNGRYAIMHDIYYNYYRIAFDKMYEDETAARAEMLNVLNLLTNFNNDNPNTMINQFFFQGKTTELIKIFSINFHSKPVVDIQSFGYSIVVYILRSA